MSRWDSRVLGIPFPSLEAELGGLLNKPPDKQGGLWNISGSITAHTLDWGRGSRELGESRGFIADCWGCSELLAATQACPVIALCLLSVLFFIATQWGRYHYYSSCPEERLLVNQERSNEVLNTSISRSDGGRGELQIWKTVSQGSCRPWLHGVTEREVSIMTPRFLSWVTGWIILPCADMRAYTDFPFGTVWSEVSEQHPTGKSHEHLDILVWAWARCQVENSESSLHRSACLHTHTSQESSLTHCYTVRHFSSS